MLKRVGCRDFRYFGLRVLRVQGFGRLGLGSRGLRVFGN